MNEKRIYNRNLSSHKGGVIGPEDARIPTVCNKCQGEFFSEFTHDYSRFVRDSFPYISPPAIYPNFLLISNDSEIDDKYFVIGICDSHAKGYHSLLNKVQYFSPNSYRIMVKRDDIKSAYKLLEVSKIHEGP